MNKKNTVTEEQINEILTASKIKVKTIFKKCTLVTVKLPNGFIITESSACVDKKNYDEGLGYEICMGKIKDKIWELEGYRLQCENYNRKNCNQLQKCSDPDCVKQSFSPTNCYPSICHCDNDCECDCNKEETSKINSTGCLFNINVDTDADVLVAYKNSVREDYCNKEE